MRRTSVLSLVAVTFRACFLGNRGMLFECISLRTRLGQLWVFIRRAFCQSTPCIFFLIFEKAFVFNSPVIRSFTIQLSECADAILASPARLEPGSVLVGIPLIAPDSHLIKGFFLDAFSIFLREKNEMPAILNNQTLCGKWTLHCE